jgi:hypothetical protein
MQCGEFVSHRLDPSIQFGQLRRRIIAQVRRA